jgi:hemerythrin-like domain-containing protein
MRKHQAHMRHLVRFLDEHLDKNHHGKEELLFLMAAKRSASWWRVARLVSEHGRRGNVAR